jgi:hypothetical protein
MEVSTGEGFLRLFAKYVDESISVLAYICLLHRGAIYVQLAC